MGFLRGKVVTLSGQPWVCSTLENDRYGIDPCERQVLQGGRLDRPRGETIFKIGRTKPKDESGARYIPAAVHATIFVLLLSQIMGLTLHQL